MKATDRTILIALCVAALVGVFMFVVLMPKRSEAGKLDEQVTKARTEVAEVEAQVKFATEARETFPRDYRRLIVLGKAVPSDSDTPSMLVQLSRIAKQNHVQFRGIQLDEGASTQAAAPPATGGSGSGGQEQGKDSGGSGDSAPSSPPSSSGQPASTAGQPSPAAATEAAAASLPIGATVGSAGLPVMPYKLSFRGDFFRIGDFIAGLQKLVNPKAQHVSVSGRLLTIDGFSFTRDELVGFPKLKVSFVVTTYLTPTDQGLTAGATPSGPGPVAQGEAQTVTNQGEKP